MEGKSILSSWRASNEQVSTSTNNYQASTTGTRQGGQTTSTNNYGGPIRPPGWYLSDVDHFYEENDS
jgi:hypothetical protein